MWNWVCFSLRNFQSETGLLRCISRHFRSLHSNRPWPWTNQRARIHIDRGMFLRVTLYFSKPVGRVKIQETDKNIPRYYTNRRFIIQHVSFSKLWTFWSRELGGTTTSRNIVEYLYSFRALLVLYWVELNNKDSLRKIRDSAPCILQQYLANNVNVWEKQASRENNINLRILLDTKRKFLFPNHLAMDLRRRMPNLYY